MEKHPETTTVKAESPVQAKKSFISINWLLPIQVIKNIPNDDLHEIFLKGRITSMFLYSVIVGLTAFLLIKAGGLVPTHALGFAIVFVFIYITIRLVGSTEETNKLLSEEVQMKLRKIDRLPALVKAHEVERSEFEKVIEGERARLAEAQTWLDDFNLKTKALEVKTTRLENEKALLVNDNVDLKIKVDLMADNMSEFDDILSAARQETYAMAVTHTEELVRIEKSLKQTNISDLNREEKEAAKKRIAEERDSLLKGDEVTAV